MTYASRRTSSEYTKNKSRLYEPDTGACYAGYSQNLFARQLTVAYIFSKRAPNSGATLVDRVTGSRYHVKNVIHLQNGEKVSTYELVLNHIEPVDAAHA